MSLTNGHSNYLITLLVHSHPAHQLQPKYKYAGSICIKISNKKSPNERENKYGVVKRGTLEETFPSAIVQALNQNEFTSIERTVRNANQRSGA
jgi:hypothetical protein